MERITTERIAFDPVIRKLITWYEKHGSEYVGTRDELLAVHMSLGTDTQVSGDVAGAVRTWVEEQKNDRV